MQSTTKLWARVGGSLIFGNLVIENDSQNRVATFSDRKQFDAWCESEGVSPSDIAW